MIFFLRFDALVSVKSSLQDKLPTDDESLRNYAERLEHKCFEEHGHTVESYIHAVREGMTRVMSYNKMPSSNNTNNYTQPPQPQPQQTSHYGHPQMRYTHQNIQQNQPMTNYQVPHGYSNQSRQSMYPPVMQQPVIQKMQPKHPNIQQPHQHPHMSNTHQMTTSQHSMQHGSQHPMPQKPIHQIQPNTHAMQPQINMHPIQTNHGIPSQHRQMSRPIQQSNQHGMQPSMPQQSHNTMQQQGHGTMQQQTHSSMQQSHNTMQPPTHNTMQQQGHGTMQQQTHNTMQSQSHHTMQQQSHSTMQQSTQHNMAPQPSQHSMQRPQHQIQPIIPNSNYLYMPQRNNKGTTNTYQTNTVQPMQGNNYQPKYINQPVNIRPHIQPPISNVQPIHPGHHYPMNSGYQDKKVPYYDANKPSPKVPPNSTQQPYPPNFQNTAPSNAKRTMVAPNNKNFIEKRVPPPGKENEVKNIPTQPKVPTQGVVPNQVSTEKPPVTLDEILRMFKAKSNSKCDQTFEKYILQFEKGARTTESLKKIYRAIEKNSSNSRLYWWEPKIRSDISLERDKIDAHVYPSKKLKSNSYDDNQDFFHIDKFLPERAFKTK